MIFSEVISLLNEKGGGSVSGLTSSARALFLKNIFEWSHKPVAAIVECNRTAEHIKTDLLSTGLSNVEVFTSLDASPYLDEDPHPEKVMERASAIRKMLKKKLNILLISAPVLAFKYPCFEQLKNNGIELETGKEFSPEKLKVLLTKYGYREHDSVVASGEFSCRGGIVDIFAVGYNQPVRIEYFGDFINSMRFFDYSSQRSTGKIERCDVYPVNLVNFYEPELENWKVKISELGCNSDELNEYASCLRTQGFLRHSDYFMPLFSEKVVSFHKWLDGYFTLCFSPANILEIVEKVRKEIISGHASSRKTLWLKPSMFLEESNKIKSELERLTALKVCDISDFHGVLNINCEPSVKYGGHLSKFIETVSSMIAAKNKVVIAITSEKKADKLLLMFEEARLSVKLADSGNWDFADCIDSQVVLIISLYRNGFSLPAKKFHLITETDIFGEGKQLPSFSKSGKSPFFSDFKDIKPGSYLVHIDHGIGVFKGLKTITVDNTSSEFMELEYKGGGKLFVPPHRIDLLQKYNYTEDVHPALDKLGGLSWDRKKKSIKKSMKNLTEKLLKLYAERQNTKGYAFSPDTEWQKEFEESFSYEETPDQITSLAEIKRDMEKEQPMDRLLCGDVGFGKTEVAIRAAFKAVMDGKQVAILAPTTVLSFQHFNTLKKRLARYPLKIDLMNRFRSKEEIREIITSVKRGTTDILIGTHRILSKDVKYKSLGLLIIDEEQRFGVEHKEKLKESFKGIDVLTLTATPIPRTLHMGFAGIRDISILRTPPDNRMTIHTSVIPFDRTTISKAINRELERGGQVYFVNNTVKGLLPLSELVDKMCPLAKTVIAHGQMSEGMLESAMISFIEKKYNVLLTTTIIENGIDLPSVNTIIVNRAENFGLAQLYQLRGRVGRSDKRAYAYLLHPHDKMLSATAKKRLKAIQEFSSLGSGFRLAAMDMEIRGAGNLLGAEQSGHINTVGFETYSRLLSEASAEIRGEPLSSYIKPVIKMNINIFIPEEYIPDCSQRIDVYKRIAQAENYEELTHLKGEIEDLFGALPFQVEELIKIAQLKLRAAELGVESIEKGDKGLFFKFHRLDGLTGERVADLVARSQYTSLLSPDCIKFEIPSDLKDPVALSMKILKQLA